MPESEELLKENKLFRRLLWIRHGCTGLYGDDGEMQCSTCMIDFKRDPADLIERQFVDNNMKEYLKSICL